MDLASLSKISYKVVVVHAVIPALEKLRQEDCEFETNLGYRARPCLRKKQNKQQQF
jgi:hypothetical protein